jgi:hypothetical protein
MTGHLLASNRRALLVIGVVLAILTASLGAARSARSAYTGVASGAVVTVTSSVQGTDGKSYSVTNHLTRAAFAPGPHEWLLAWAGADGSVHPDAPDFVAVIDVTTGSPSYGQVVNTATMTPQLQNEPHHMQYIWRPGQHIYLGGVLSDTTWVLDTSQLPALRISGINLPADTPCGSAPDAYTVLPDDTAYATYMGGPDVSGPCTYSDGSVREGNGYGGSPGEIVHIGKDGRTISEMPAAVAGGEDPDLCHNIPAIPQATCANPHGIQIRPDLRRMVTSDFAEVRNYLTTAPIEPKFDPALVRDTVRIFDTSRPDRARLLSVTHLPSGPRAPSEQFKILTEDKIVMESAVTNLPQHRGAFVSTMWGGAIYYTPDITARHPTWREVFDDQTAYRTFHPGGEVPSGGDGGGWLATSLDDRYLYHIVLGQQRRIYNLPMDIVAGMVYALDIRKLLAAGNDPDCQIDTVAEVSGGGQEEDCPALAGVLPVKDTTTGGPHWGAMDNLAAGRDGRYRPTTHVGRLAYANYFVKALDADGNHLVCLANLSRSGAPTLDASFTDEVTHRSCVDFNRTDWPHGTYGGARPHGVLFVTSNSIPQLSRFGGSNG